MTYNTVTEDVTYDFVETELLSVGISAADFAAMQSLPATQTGTGAMVLATSPTLVTPVLGVAAATTVNVGTGGYKVSTVKVIGAQGAAIINATDGSSAITQLNLLLAAARTHGLIAT